MNTLSPGDIAEMNVGIENSITGTVKRETIWESRRETFIRLLGSLPVVIWCIVLITLKTDAGHGATGINRVIPCLFFSNAMRAITQRTALKEPDVPEFSSSEWMGFGLWTIATIGTVRWTWADSHG